MRHLALIALAAVTAATAFHGTAARLTPAQRTAVIQAGEYHRGCPVTLSQLRLLTVSYYGFDHRTHMGQILVNGRAAASVTTVFHRLYEMKFPIHHMEFADTYGPPNTKRPADGDFTASFECRQAASSPCTGNPTGRTGSWSEHAYGEAIDLNPVENPYVGCGMTRDKTALSYLDRTRQRRGMVTPAVLALFHSIGWGWGGSWAGSTKDYMHFSATGH
jgi:hypothetical protein